MHNLERVPHYEIAEFIKKQLDFDFTEAQRNYMSEVLAEHIRKSNLIIYRRKKKYSNFWFRLTTPLFMITCLFVWLSLPIVFILTGRWGYDIKKVQWFINWMSKLGLDF